MVHRTRSAHRAGSIGARRRRRAVLATLALLIGPIVSVVGAAPASASACHTTWGSKPKGIGPMATTPITNVRAGRHDCYDRLVIDLRPGVTPGFNIRYVTKVISDGSGFVVPLRGGAFIQISVKAPTYDLGGHSTYSPVNPSEAVSVAGFRTFRQVAFAGSFEGYSTFGLGVRARLPFRVLGSTGTDGRRHLIVDVAHTWA